MPKAIPDGFTTLTPSFTFKDSKKAIEFKLSGKVLPGETTSGESSEPQRVTTAKPPVQ